MPAKEMLLKEPYWQTIEKNGDKSGWVEIISGWMDKYAQEQVKNCSIPDVSESGFQEMFECLRDLMDLQNGCPLPTYKDAYDETIDRCNKTLSKYEELHSR